MLSLGIFWLLQAALVRARSVPCSGPAPPRELLCGRGDELKLWLRGHPHLLVPIPHPSGRDTPGFGVVGAESSFQTRPVALKSRLRANRF